MEDFKLLRYEEQQILIASLNDHVCFSAHLTDIVRELYSKGFDLAELKRISDNTKRANQVSVLDISDTHNITLGQAYVVSTIHNSSVIPYRLLHVEDDIILTHCSEQTLNDLAVLTFPHIRWTDGKSIIRDISVGPLGAIDCYERIINKICLPHHGDPRNLPLPISHIYPKVDGRPIGLVTFAGDHYMVDILNATTPIVIEAIDQDCGHHLEYCSLTGKYYARNYTGTREDIVQVPEVSIYKMAEAARTKKYDGSIPCDGFILTCHYLEFRIKFELTYDLLYSGVWSLSVITPVEKPIEAGVYELNGEGKIIRRRYDKIRSNGYEKDLLVSRSITFGSEEFTRLLACCDSEHNDMFDPQEYELLSIDNPTLDNVSKLQLYNSDSNDLQSYLYYSSRVIVRDKLYPS